MASEGTKMWALDRVGYHFHYDRRERRVFTHHLLVANSKEHGPLSVRLGTGGEGRFRDGT